MQNNFKKIKIACLPVAGAEDPGQILLMEGLNKNHQLDAFNGVNDKFFGIIKTALQFRPDFFHFDWIESFYFRKFIGFTLLSIPIFFIQLWICRHLLKIKITWTLHNQIPHDKRQIKIKKLVQRGFAKMSYFIRVLSPQSIDSAAAQLKVETSKIVFVGTGSFTDYYPDDTILDDAYKITGISKGKRILLNLGSIKPYKGIIELIDAFKQIKPVDTILLIAGKSYDQEYLMQIKKHIGQDIILHERFIPPNEVQFYYKIADFVVLPFLEIENSGSVIMAMGFKKPIIAPNSNIINYRLKNQKELIYEGDHLKETIVRALQMNINDIQKLGEYNYRELFNHKWEDFGALYLQHSLNK